MSSVVDRIFGGVDDSAQKYQINQNADSRRFITNQGNQAQQLLGGYLPQIQGQLGRGYQSAANLLSGLIPQQINAFQQGNLQAQNYLLGGLPAYQQAIMGMPVDFGSIAMNTPRAQIQYDPNFLNQPLPNPLAGA